MGTSLNFHRTLYQDQFDGKKINIVWNVTRMCPFACELCCVSAIHIKSFKHHNTDDYSELNFNQKRSIIDQLDPDYFSLDLSGGDLLLDPSHLDLIAYASNKFNGNLDITIPGSFVNMSVVKKIKKHIKNVEVTVDLPPSVIDNARPYNYNKISLSAAKRLAENGINVSIQTVLRKENMHMDILQDLYDCFLAIGIKKWSFLRLFPVGRYSNHYKDIPSRADYANIVALIKKKFKNVSFDLQFQYILSESWGEEIQCRACVKSVGITPKGIVTSCFWAFGLDGEPLDEFVLGKMPDQNIYDIMLSDRAKAWKRYAMENEGCALLEKLIPRP